MSTVIGVDLPRGTIGTFTVMSVSASDASGALLRLRGFIAPATPSAGELNLPPRGVIGYLSLTTTTTAALPRSEVQRLTAAYPVAILVQRGTGGAGPDDLIDLARAYDPLYQEATRTGATLGRTARAAGDKAEEIFNAIAPGIGEAIDRNVKIAIIGGLIVLLLLGIFLIWTKL